MNQYSISTPEGTRDRLFDFSRGLRRTESSIRSALERRGYNEIVTPSIEYYDVFQQAGSALPQETMLKVIDRSGHILVLRPDNTTPIARIAGTKLPDSMFPVRLYYSQNVFRSHSGGRGRRAEIRQIGAELLGADGLMADLDILSAAFEALEATGAVAFRIELGHAGIYKGLISSLGIDADEAEDIRRLIENKSFAALGDALEPYRDREAYSALRAMPQLFGGTEVLDEAEKLTENSQVRAAVSYLRRVLEALSAAGFSESIMIDLGLVHEMDYYTGMMFRGYTDAAGSTILSGGRYNALCEKFGKARPATGFAIDLESVADSVEPMHEDAPEEALYCTPAYLQQALQYLSDRGRRTVLAPCDTEREAMRYAADAGIGMLAVLDSGEIRYEEVRV